MKPDTRLRSFKAAAAYFGLVFGAGFLLGTVRVIFVVPQLGERNAELFETPFMLFVTFLAARWLVNRFAIVDGRRLVAIGCIALLLLLGAEVGVGGARC